VCMTRADVAKAFGKVLKDQRRLRGLTQEELAGRCDNVDRTYPSLLERGRRTPTLEIIVELAEALRITPAHLLDLTMKQRTVDEAARARSRESQASRKSLAPPGNITPAHKGK
jgi:transcriptional regulator with XRE-family HTH domain